MALGSDNLKDIFGTCLGIVDHRLSDMPALMMLSGRMELIATQLTSKSNKDLNNEIDLSQMLVYDDKSGEFSLVCDKTREILEVSLQTTTRTMTIFGCMKIQTMEI